MENELTYVLIALICVLGILLIVFLFLHLRDLRDQSTLRKELDVLKKEKDELEKKALSAFNVQANDIINAANKKAAEIISNASGLSEQEKTVLNQTFQQMLNANLRDYQQTAGKFSKTYDEFMANIGRDIKARLDMGLNKASSDAQTEIKKTSSAIAGSLQNLYKGYETEVSEYKKQVLSQIEAIGVDVIKQVALSVLGKTLSKKETEELIIASLEEAKKTGFFE